MAGALLLASAVQAEDWPQFRGPGGKGISEETNLPTHWGPEENIRWKADLPGRGLSSPVVVGGKVYLTACTGVTQSRLHVLCFDAVHGKKLWERQLHATGNTLCHPKTCMAAPTPVVDGERIYALFATGDLAGFDAAGNLLWYRALAQDYPGLTNQVGMAASPVLWKDVLIVPMESAGESFALGLDKLTGRNRWKVDRPQEINWVTPLLITHDGRDEVLFQSSQDVTAYDPATGRQNWTYSDKEGFAGSTIPSAAMGEEVIVSGGGMALRPGPAAATMIWKASKLKPAYASPLFYRGRVYAVNNSAILLNCFNAQDGKVLWQQRVKGPFSASPVAADGKLYLVNEEGVTTILQAGDQPRILGTNALPEQFLATPALAGGCIFLRSDQHLYCIGRGEPGQGAAARSN
ncbi:MAG: PQQ-binding-like beta-propeller repeat protein [Planctomycetes bacterium]|nr:PQQ-binding-like beta-propeller repeat protein [Planctomycetota bacterium]